MTTVLQKIVGILGAADLVSADSNFTTNLSRSEGPQPQDVWAVRTAYGWFEVPITGVFLTSPDNLTSLATDINDTRTSIDMWTPPSLFANSSVTTATVKKRSWDGSDSNAWPAAFYGAFQSLYHPPLVAADGILEHALQNVQNAECLLSAVQGNGFTSSICPINTTSQLFLAVVNTTNGVQIEAVTETNSTNNTVKVLRWQSSSVVGATPQLSTWSLDCLGTWLHA